MKWSPETRSGRRSSGGSSRHPECSVDRSSRPETNRSMRFGFRESAVTAAGGNGELVAKVRVRQVAQRSVQLPSENVV